MQILTGCVGKIQSLNVKKGLCLEWLNYLVQDLVRRVCSVVNQLAILCYIFCAIEFNICLCVSALNI